MSTINMPLVSVAIITYNQKDFLKECIDSIIGQSYKNIEIIVADDGSTDGTQELLKKYASFNPGIFLLKLSKSNRGITPNSNSAHFACSGKYIAWMGGDDLMLPEKISTQVEFMEKNPDCTICYHDLDVFYSDNATKNHLFSRNSKPREGLVNCSIKHGTFNGACSTMVRREKTPPNGFDNTLPVASDWLYWIESLMNGGTIRYIDETLGRYRRHSSNVTNLKKGVTQHSLDKLNTCNIIISKYPEFFSEAMYSLSQNYISLRKNLPYFRCLLLSMRIKLRLKAFFAALIYIVTISTVKL